MWWQDTSKAAPPRAKISRGGLAWGLEGLVLDHLSVSRVAAGLGVSWSAANSAILTEGCRRLIDDPARFDGVTTIGVDEHVWRHTRHGDKYVTVIIDLTRIPLKRIPLVRVCDVEVTDLHPGEWGGWGYRVTSGRSAIILRTGPGMIVTTIDGTRFALTLAAPEVPAGLLRTLADTLTSSSER